MNGYWLLVELRSSLLSFGNNQASLLLLSLTRSLIGYWLLNCLGARSKEQEDCSTCHFTLATDSKLYTLISTLSMVNGQWSMVNEQSSTLSTLNFPSGGGRSERQVGFTRPFCVDSDIDIC